MPNNPTLSSADVTEEMRVLIRDFFGDSVRLDKFQLEMTTADGTVHLSWALSAKTL